MGKLNDAKLLGGIGSILTILSVIPYGGFAVGIAGLVLVLVAVKYISDYFNDPSIFNNMLISVILAIVGTVAAAVGFLGALFGIVSLGAISSVQRTVSFMPVMSSFLLLIVLGLLAIWAVLLVSAIFLRRSFNTIAERLGIGLFSTAALLYLIGAALTIVLVGFIVIFIAEIVQAIAFFSIEEPKQIHQQPVPE